MQSSVDEVIAMLQQSPGLPSVPEVGGLVVSWFVTACDCVSAIQINSMKKEEEHAKSSFFWVRCSLCRAFPCWQEAPPTR